MFLDALFDFSEMPTLTQQCNTYRKPHGEKEMAAQNSTGSLPKSTASKNAASFFRNLGDVFLNPVTNAVAPGRKLVTEGERPHIVTLRGGRG